MLKLSLQLDLTPDDRAKMLAMLSDIGDVRRAQGNRAANQVLLDRLSLALVPERDEDFYSLALHYHLGQVYAHLGMAKEAAEHFERSQTLPHAGEALVYSEQLAESLALREQQVARLHIPSILIASMPRAASASLTQSLSATLDIPILRPSAGYFPEPILVPRWLRLFMSGGAVSHDHFVASAFNLDAMASIGIKSVFVLVRDPRAAAASLQKIFGLHGDHDADTVFDTLLSQYVSWLEGWCSGAARGTISVRWIRYSDFVSDPATTIRSILSHFQTAHCIAPVIRAENLGAGDDNAWRKVISRHLASRWWPRIPQAAKDLLSLTP